ncbi:MAG: hypothetical protein Q4C13_03470 [Clostridia bacterium]|nr:hypothetical protein [Clostridia bacterium]
MKYCKLCGVLYSDENACCPKCNAALDAYAPPEPPEADSRTKRAQWLALCLGIPAMIGLFYLFFWLIRSAVQ